MEYPKINSLWKREGWYFDEKVKQKTPHELQGKRQSLIIGDYAEPEFANIKNWRVDEKIDGTNIRIHYSSGMNPIFLGRTKDAQIPTHLFKFLQEHFTKERLLEQFPDHLNVFLFGEGYGPKIQAGGGRYRADPGFILFDILVGNWWLKREDVSAIAEKLGVPMVPDLGVMTEDQIVEYVKSKPNSVLTPGYGMMEGVVCRSDPLMLFRKGTPLMFKLKCKEFV